MTKEDNNEKTLRLESKHLVLKLADRASFLETKTLGGFLETAHHGRGTAEQDLDIVGRLRKPFLQKTS
jgi:hypothetical protein